MDKIERNLIAVTSTLRTVLTREMLQGYPPSHNTCLVRDGCCIDVTLLCFIGNMFNTCTIDLVLLQNIV